MLVVVVPPCPGADSVVSLLKMDFASETTRAGGAHRFFATHPLLCVQT
jgi:hypothetical protein